VRAGGEGGEDGTGTSRTRARVRCGAGGNEGPDRRASPVSAEGERERRRGRRGQSGPGRGNGPRAREGKKEERKKAAAGWAVEAGGLHAGERKEGRGERLWAGL
jgi:hypothetical protein